MYVSPLGRAKYTASFTSEIRNQEVKELDFLHEFKGRIHLPYKDVKDSIWDMYPEEWANEEIYYDVNHWYDTPLMQEYDVKSLALKSIHDCDAFLQEHGYQREGNIYKVTNSNHDTIVFFCHLGIQCLFLAHLMNVSPMALWYGMALPPSSVTIVNTEERKEGYASFRCNQIGDTSHLYKVDQEPSFVGRFCECYEDDTLHEFPDKFKEKA